MVSKTKHIACLMDYKMGVWVYAYICINRVGLTQMFYMRKKQVNAHRTYGGTGHTLQYGPRNQQWHQ